jgi:hypothetical protein
LSSVATLVSLLSFRASGGQASGHHGMVNEWLTHETP